MPEYKGSSAIVCAIPVKNGFANAAAKPAQLASRTTPNAVIASYPSLIQIGIINEMKITSSSRIPVKVTLKKIAVMITGAITYKPCFLSLVVSATTEASSRPMCLMIPKAPPTNTTTPITPEADLKPLKNDSKKEANVVGLLANNV